MDAYEEAIEQVRAPRPRVKRPARGVLRRARPSRPATLTAPSSITP